MEADHPGEKKKKKKKAGSKEKCERGGKNEIANPKWFSGKIEK